MYHIFFLHSAPSNGFTFSVWDSLTNQRENGKLSVVLKKENLHIVFSLRMRASSPFEESRAVTCSHVRAARERRHTFARGLLRLP